MLKVYKASAGSGKTFRLVLEYILLVLKHPVNYRRILAVTFTNKATAEMKERVVQELYQLSVEQSTPYLHLIEKETGLSTPEIASKARQSLQSILYDYHRFSISTIDKFSQRVIKAFNRETGIVPNYQVELDTDVLLQEAADRMIASLGNNTPLLRWLEEFVEEKIADGRNFSVENDIRNLGSELFNEQLQKELPSLQQFFEDSGNGNAYLGKLQQIIRKFEIDLKKIASQMVQCYTDQNFKLEDFSYQKSSPVAMIEKAANGVVPEAFGNRYYEWLGSADKWVAKKHIRRDELTKLVANSLLPQLISFNNYFESHSRDYFTAMAVKREWYMMMVLMDLNREISRVSRERNVLAMASSNMLLQAIIDDNDAPFIYEKIGNIYHHFMLDEFQDTSGMQWRNFKPLLDNGLAQGKFSLVVGDVKQSIYRWRNSDWNILGSKIYDDFSHQKIETNHLDVNFRSDANIVSFNNEFFAGIKSALLAHEDLSNKKEGYSLHLEQLYNDIAQYSSRDEIKGYIRIEQLENSDNNFTDRALHRLLSQVCELQDMGYSPDDIAILIRKKDQGSLIINYFLQASLQPEYQKYQLKIVSDESLFIAASAAVNFVAGVLQFLSQPDDLINRGTILHLYMNLPQTGRTKQTNEVWYLPPEYAEIFEIQLGEKLRSVAAKISFSGLEEIITTICATFSLFNLPSELPYLQTLIDKVAEVRRSALLDLSNFSLWWHDRGVKISVQASESSDAIRLLTIHKSKGLQFKAVLVPFFNWSWLNNRQGVMWCKPATEPFNRVSLVPVEAGSGLMRTHFAGNYQDELFNLLIDNLNMVYVAFTRAQSVLMVNFPGTYRQGAFTEFLDKALQSMAVPARFEEGGDVSAVYEWGKPETIHTVSEVRTATPSQAWAHFDFTGRLRLRSEINELEPSSRAGISKSDLGNTVHLLLSQIVTVADVDNVLKRAQKSQLLKGILAEDIAETMTKMLRSPEVSEWFDGSWKVMNERILLTPESQYRPDRLMVKGNSAIIVDYKTGAAELPEHLKQIKTYCGLVKAGGYEEVSGFIWYLQSERIVKAYPEGEQT